MLKILLFIVLGLIFVGIATFISNQKKGSGEKEVEKPKEDIGKYYYLKKSLFTKTEYVFFQELQKQNNNQFVINSKVRLEDIVGVAKGIGKGKYNPMRSHIKSRHVDFVIVGQSGDILAVIESPRLIPRCLHRFFCYTNNMKAKHISKSHNKTLLIYHLVCPVKYRRKVFTEEVSQSLKKICLEFGPAYEVHFLEIGIDEDHVHFLIQTTPNQSFSNIVKKIKSISARYIFTQHKEVKEFLWGGKFWTSGYYANTVGQFGNLNMITNYVQKQGIPDYHQIHSGQITLFDQ